MLGGQKKKRLRPSGKRDSFRRENSPGLQTNRAVSGAIRFRLFGMADQENRMNGRRSDGDRLENNKRKQRKGDIS